MQKKETLADVKLASSSQDGHGVIPLLAAAKENICVSDDSSQVLIGYKGDGEENDK